MKRCGQPARLIAVLRENSKATGLFSCGLLRWCMALAPPTFRHTEGASSPAGEEAAAALEFWLTAGAI